MLWLQRQVATIYVAITHDTVVVSDNREASDIVQSIKEIAVKAFNTAMKGLKRCLLPTVS